MHGYCFLFKYKYAVRCYQKKREVIELLSMCSTCNNLQNTTLALFISPSVCVYTIRHYSRHVPNAARRRCWHMRV